MSRGEEQREREEGTVDNFPTIDKLLTPCLYVYLDKMFVLNVSLIQRFHCYVQLRNCVSNSHF